MADTPFHLDSDAATGNADGRRARRRSVIRSPFRAPVVAAVLLALAGGLAACGANDKATKPESGAAIVIGNVGTTSGSLGARYGIMQQAIKAWAEVVNRNGGIAGLPVRVEVADDADDPAKHLSLVREMVEQKHVVAFAGVPSTETQGASVEYLEEKGVPVVGGVIGELPWGTSPILFPQGFSAPNRARTLMYTAATSGKTKYAFVGTHTHGHHAHADSGHHAHADSDGHTGGDGHAGGSGHADEGTVEEIVKELKGGSAAEAGIELAFDSEIQPGAPDYTDLCLAAKRSGAELMTILADFKTQAKVVESCNRQQFKPIYVTTGTTTSQELVDTVGRNMMEGAVGISRTAPWMADEPADLTVWRKAMEANGLQANAVSELGWVSGRILEEALRRINGNITPAAVATALRGLDGENLHGLVAPLDFGSSPTEPNLGSKCFWPVVVKDGKWAPAKSGQQVCLR